MGNKKTNTQQILKLQCAFFSIPPLSLLPCLPLLRLSRSRTLSSSSKISLRPLLSRTSQSPNRLSPLPQPSPTKRRLSTLEVLSSLRIPRPLLSLPTKRRSPTRSASALMPMRQIRPVSSTLSVESSVAPPLLPSVVLLPQVLPLVLLDAPLLETVEVLLALVPLMPLPRRLRRPTRLFRRLRPT